MQSARDSKKEINLRFGTAVRRYRHDLGLSQEALAEAAGLDRTYIGHVERGARNVSLSTIDKLARALKVSTAALLSSISEHEPGSPEATAGWSFGARTDILMVEDHRRDAELALKALKRAGITNSIHVVYDGAEALDFLFCRGRYLHRRMAGMPRIVLLDLNLPKVSGMEVLRRIKADSRTRSVHVVVLTGSCSDESIAEALKLGADAYLTKPVDFRSFSEVTPKLRFGWALVPARV